MNRSLLSLLAVTLLGVVAVTMPSRGRAATLHDNDYVRIGVPDLPQAVDFFRDVLDCQLISPPGPTGELDRRSDSTGSGLLACESGTIVELFDNRATSPSRPVRPAKETIQFISGSVAGANQWLERKGVRVVGSPQTLTSGPHAGMTVVSFETPWGLRLQLVGWDTNTATAGP